MSMVNEQNFSELTEAWQKTYISTITVGQLEPGKATEDVFNLSVLKGSITTSNEVILAPFKMQTVANVTKVTGHMKWEHVITEPKEQGFSSEVITTSTYRDLKPGSIRVKVCLWNLTSQKVTIPAWCVVSQVQAANEVPSIYAPVTLKRHVISRAPFPMMETGWPLDPLSTVESLSDGPQLMLNSRFPSPIGPSWNKLPIGVQILGARRLPSTCKLVSRVCRHVLETWSWPRGDLGSGAWD